MRLDYEYLERWYASEQEAHAETEARAEDAEKKLATALETISNLTAQLEEREADMHARIRAGYDRCVTDAWRAKLTEVEKKLEMLSKAAVGVLKYRAGNMGAWGPLVDAVQIIGVEVDDVND